MAVAIIPARGGSKRIPRKNIRAFHGKPIISYSITAAVSSGLFDRVIVSTDDEESRVIFLISSIICAEIFLLDLEILNLNLSEDETFFTLLVTLNFFLSIAFNFIIFSFPLFLICIDLFLLFLCLYTALVF